MLPSISSRRERVSTLPVFDNYSRYSSGAVSGAMKTGQAWSTFQPGAVSGEWFDATGTQATYLECNTGLAGISRIGAEWIFDDQAGSLTGTGSTMTLISWADGGIVANGFGRRTSMHVAITRSAVLWYIRDVVDGGTVTLVSNQTISPPLPLNEVVGADVTITAVGSGLVRLRDGRSYTVTDSRIAQYTGEVYACWEPYYNGSATAPRVRIGRVWANGPALPPPSLDPAIAQSVYSSTTTSVTTQTITLPAISDNDIVILMSESLANSSTHTISGTPTFTKHGVQSNRTGISTALFYKTGSSSDTGQTMTVTASASAPMHIGVWVLRNVKSIYTDGIATTNQASGSTTLTFPAYTPVAGRTVLQIASFGRGTAAAATLTPGSNTQIISSQLPGATGARSGFAVGVPTNWSSTLTPGTTWTNTSDHYAATWLVPITL